jgi:hypothetical protein
VAAVAPAVFTQHGRGMSGPIMPAGGGPPEQTKRSSYADTDAPMDVPHTEKWLEVSRMHGLWCLQFAALTAQTPIVVAATGAVKVVITCERGGVSPKARPRGSRGGFKGGAVVIS